MPDTASEAHAGAGSTCLGEARHTVTPHRIVIPHGIVAPVSAIGRIEGSQKRGPDLCQQGWTHRISGVAPREARVGTCIPRRKTKGMGWERRWVPLSLGGRRQTPYPPCPCRNREEQAGLSRSTSGSDRVVIQVWAQCVPGLLPSFICSFTDAWVRD